MRQSTLFKSNKSQAVRLPKEVALPEEVKKVDIIKLGKARLIAPAGTSWESWFDGPGVSEDFMNDREQPEAEAEVQKERQAKEEAEAKNRKLEAELEELRKANHIKSE